MRSPGNDRMPGQNAWSKDSPGTWGTGAGKARRVESERKRQLSKEVGWGKDWAELIGCNH